MKKIIAWMLMLALILSVVTAVSEEVSKYDKLTVSTTTPFNGNFLSEALGNNISDLDVRRLIHGYNLVYWDGEKGSYQFNPKIISDASVTEDGTSFIFALAEGLKYCDGTPITARDYAFSLLLLGSPEMREATGSSSDLSRILGGRDYQEGKTFELKGLRVLGDYQFTLSIDPEFMPYFYQLKLLDISPLPISVRPDHPETSGACVPSGARITAVPSFFRPRIQWESRLTFRISRQELSSSDSSSGAAITVPSCRTAAKVY